MTSPNNQDWERRFQELEVEVDPEPESQPPVSESLEKGIDQLKTWYGGLPTPGKAGVAVGGALLAFSLLNTVLKLVTSLLSIVVLVVVLYGAYKFLLAPRPHD
jgi:hypothetical protein